MRLGEQDRRRGRKLAQKMGLSENRLYSDLIQEGLLMREQMSYFEKLRSANVPAREGLDLLNLAPDAPPAPEDVMLLPKSRRSRLARRSEAGKNKG